MFLHAGIQEKENKYTFNSSSHEHSLATYFYEELWCSTLGRGAGLVIGSVKTAELYNTLFFQHSYRISAKKKSKKSAHLVSLQCKEAFPDLIKAKRRAKNVLNSLRTNLNRCHLGCRSPLNSTGQWLRLRKWRHFAPIYTCPSDNCATHSTIIAELPLLRLEAQKLKRKRAQLKDGLTCHIFLTSLDFKIIYE